MRYSPIYGGWRDIVGRSYSEKSGRGDMYSFSRDDCQETRDYVGFRVHREVR